MGTLAAEVIIDAAEKTLLDETNIRWGETELLGYLNDGQRFIVMKKPDAYTKNDTVPLASGGTKNTVPDDAIEFIRLTRDMGADGETPGQVIKFADMTHLDDTDPMWHTRTTNGAPYHFLRDPFDNKHFYVYPAPSGTRHAEMIYSADPEDVAEKDDPITLDNVYKDLLYFYILWRAHSKETSAANPERAAVYFGMLDKGLNDKSQAEAGLKGAVVAASMSIRSTS